jgi:hypothetical protein
LKKLLRKLKIKHGYMKEQKEDLVLPTQRFKGTCDYMQMELLENKDLEIKHKKRFLPTL